MKLVGLIVLVAAVVAVAAGGAVAFVMSRHDSASGTTHRAGAASSSAPAGPATTFTTDQKRSWTDAIEPVSSALYKATVTGLKKCNDQYTPASDQYVRCTTDLFASLAAAIEQGQITVNSMVGQLHGQCRSDVQQYIALLRKFHHRATQLLTATENRDYTQGQTLLRQLDGATLISAATPVVHACEPSAFG